MVDGESLDWGDRFSRDIRVGHIGYFANTEIVNNYKYKDAKSKHLIYYADDLFWLSSGTGSLWGDGNTVTFSSSNFTVGAVTAIFPYIIIPSTGTRVKVKPPIGGTLVGLTVGFKNVVVGTLVTTKFISIDPKGGSTALATNPLTILETQTWTETSATNNYNVFTQSLTYNSEIDSHDDYLFFIGHNDASNSLHLYWIRLEIEMSDLESATGLE